MKTKKSVRFKDYLKKKTIKKEKVVSSKKQNDHLKTAPSIKMDSELQNMTVPRVTLREYKQQLSLAKDYLGQTYSCFNFSNSEICLFREMAQNLTNQSSISIDKLFSKDQMHLFDGIYTLEEVSGYLKIVNNQLQNKRKKIILKTDEHTLCLAEQLNRQFMRYEPKGRFISDLQREVFLNWENFIEKIRLNQQKYKQSGSQLSQVSQQLLYLSKVYMQNRSKIQKMGDSLALQLSTTFPEPERQSQKIYYEIIMKKNIAYSFDQKQIDHLNYFKRKQHDQRNCVQVFRAIQDQNQLQSYLRTKRPKKGKSGKCPLPTACSFCFSAYNQQSNSMTTCQVCNLRCHTMCLNLKQKSCGNCSYQRICKTEKEKVYFCFICQQKGQMCIQIEESKFAHGFCLLIHNLWEVNKKKVFQTYQNRLQKKQYEHYKDYQQFEQKNVFPLNQSLYELSFNENLYRQNILQNQINPLMVNFNPQSLQKYCTRDQKPYLLEDKQPNLKQISKCRICNCQCFQSFYLQCKQCYSRHHAFCAFFEGFQFKLSKSLSQKQCGINILFDCCSKKSQQKDKLKHKRKFILNKNRFLFQNL